ncbi:MAG: SDR family NAD(P)-dependent oxidoreductase [Aestuariivita sp.]|nr:SDR family NAD(P)-dependent oxidoreductase [Aestuariivita sp.]MCY4202155.1 SDR family NAD(P)-dependent oxidoreductase [Aestuariivita sp.]MCY4289582.1 SDR family NAD(P)-dependent oxidoreductase [Aestuariivita sp.]MCY4347915.1 SDR family NAD(P)-dependent oxidoreductase [Aestuariivita sp.]
MTRFTGKSVVVTGGAGGIGSAICQRFASEGALVCVADADFAGVQTVAENIQATGGQAEAHAFNLTDPAEIRSFVRDWTRTGRKVDVLCNNAGLMRRGALMELSAEDWRQSFAVNVDALFHMCQAVIPVMQAQGGGAIINTASQWGMHPAPGHIAYNTTKAAVVAFTQNLARDYAPANIRVNGVAPGEVRTPMLESYLARSGRCLEDLNALVPYGRIGEPAEIAALVAFMASNEARYLCGSVVEITGAQAVA